jgi:hypothetical protein
MKNKRTRVVVLALMGLLANTASAQNPTRVVAVNGGTTKSEFEDRVVSALNARIGASSRFTIGGLGIAELVVDIVCLDTGTRLNGVKGGVCSFIVTFYPNELAGLGSALSGPALTGDSEPSQICENIRQRLKQGVE